MDDGTIDTMRVVRSLDEIEELIADGKLIINHIAYLYPNDEQELDRLDMQHHMFKLINEGRLFFAPVENPQRILDIGTGSGIWPMEMGKLPHLPPFFFFFCS